MRLRSLLRNKNHHIIFNNQLYLKNKLNKKEFLKVGNQIDRLLNISQNK
jgi:hypothetical protein